MLHKVRSLGLQGIYGYEVSAECDLAGGLPNFDIVGLPDAAVKEARERVRASVKNCGLDFPVSRVTVNLAPADRKKAGTVYDLPILLGILIASGQARPLPPDAAVIGEVWEDASHKVAYGQMRSYVLGDTLDSVMNYPLRDALIAFLMAQKDAAAVAKELSSLAQNYPKPFLYALMNLMGSHDRPRILNVLAGNDGSDIPRSQRADHRLSQEERMIGALREQLMLRFVFSVPGMPCIYYGDEAGVEGCADPFCRRTYPWGREDQDMLARYKAMTAMRNGHPVLKTGECAYIAPCSAVLGVIRKNENGKDAFGKKAENACAVTLINRSAREVVVYLTSADVSCAQTLVSDDGQIFTARSGAFSVKIKGLQGMTMFAM